MVTVQNFGNFRKCHTMRSISLLCYLDVGCIFILYTMQYDCYYTTVHDYSDLLAPITTTKIHLSYLLLLLCK